MNSLVSDVVGYSENFATPSRSRPSRAAALKNADENRQRVITGGAFGQALLGFKDRYFLTVGARIDGNSAFGEDFGFQTYPKVSGSWVISEEPFWAPALGSLKLRAAYGAAGRAPRRLRRRADVEPGRVGRTARRAAEQLRQRRPRTRAHDRAGARLRRERARRPPERGLHVVQRHDDRRAVQRALDSDATASSTTSSRTSAR